MNALPETPKQRDAEEIRAHLVHLRGGAPFLSPKDAHLLLSWLDSGVPLHQILTALERAADTRAKNRSKLPLSLAHARRYLKQVAASTSASQLEPHTPPPAEGPPLLPLITRLMAEPDLQSSIPAKLLAATLLSLPSGPPEELHRAAMAAIRDFFTELWEALSPQEVSEALHTATTQLQKKHPQLDPDTLGPLAEEHARHALRARFAYLCAATVTELIPS